MHKKRTIPVNARVDKGLLEVIGLRQIGRFIATLLRSRKAGQDLDHSYREMARDKLREAEALQWAEPTVLESGAE